MAEPKLGRVSDRVAWFVNGERVSPPFNTPALANKWMERHAHEFTVAADG